MAFRTTLLFCGLVLSIQNAYSQVIGLSNIYGPSYGSLGVSGVDVSAVEVDSFGLGAAYGGYGLSPAVGLGSAGALGLGAAGLGGVNALGLGAAGLGGVNALGLGAAGLGGVNALGLGAGLGVGLGAGLGGLGSSLLIENSPAFLGLNSLAAGGVLPISSIGPVVPAGLTVVSDNLIEGAVTVNGQLPFLSAVAFEGALPSGGSGVAQCGCGNGNIGIISETVGPAAGLSGVGLAGAGLAGANLAGLNGLGLGGLGGLNLGGYGGLGLIL